MTEVIEGQWEELVGRSDLRGRKVRVIVLDEVQPPHATGQAWIEKLRAWADSHTAVDHFVDDSRDSIYSGTLDDPR